MLYIFVMCLLCTSFVQAMNEKAQNQNSSTPSDTSITYTSYMLSGCTLKPIVMKRSYSTVPLSAQPNTSNQSPKKDTHQ